MTWHLDQTSAVDYSIRRTDPAIAASVEAHVMVCDQCRALVNASIDEPSLGAIWAEIEDELDRPRLSWIERALIALGCSDLTARTVGATARARWSYLAVVAFNVTLAIAFSGADRDEVAFTAFLLLAPIGPLVATVTAFGRWGDRVSQLVATLPTPTLRLMMVRLAASVVPAIALTALATPWLADHGWLAAAWLLPALALSMTTLALASWIEVELASVLVLGAWAGGALAIRLWAGNTLDAYAGPVQIVSVLAVAAATVTTLVRSGNFDYRGF
jgi:hypothetical protein